MLHAIVSLLENLAHGMVRSIYDYSEWHSGHLYCKHKCPEILRTYTHVHVVTMQK